MCGEKALALFVTHCLQHVGAMLYCTSSVKSDLGDCFDESGCFGYWDDANGMNE
jgi:hypothetical protein